MELNEKVIEKVAELNELVQAFAAANVLEIGEVKLSTNHRIGAYCIEKVETPDPRISSKDVMDYVTLNEKNESVEEIKLGSVVTGYGSVKAKSNIVKPTEYMVVTGRPTATREDVLVLERTDTGVRSNFTVDEYNFMNDNEIDEWTAGVVNGTHVMNAEGFIIPKDAVDEDDDDEL